MTGPCKTSPLNRVVGLNNSSESKQPSKAMLTPPPTRMSVHSFFSFLFFPPMSTFLCLHTFSKIKVYAASASRATENSGTPNNRWSRLVRNLHSFFYILWLFWSHTLTPKLPPPLFSWPVKTASARPKLFGIWNWTTSRPFGSLRWERLLFSCS